MSAHDDDVRAERHTIKLDELETDEAPFVAEVDAGGTRRVYVVDGIWILVSRNGRVQLRANAHTFRLSGLHNTTAPGAVSTVGFELTRTDEDR